MKSIAEAMFETNVNPLGDEAGPSIPKPPRPSQRCDKLVSFSEAVAHEVGESVTPEKYLADIFPLR